MRIVVEIATARDGRLSGTVQRPGAETPCEAVYLPFWGVMEFVAIVERLSLDDDRSVATQVEELGKRDEELGTEIENRKEACND
jgi:hypothetical protein